MKMRCKLVAQILFIMTYGGLHSAIVYAQLAPPAFKSVWFSEDETSAIDYSNFRQEIANIHNKHLHMPLSSEDQNKCEKAYSRFLSQPDLNWSIFFGYGDGDDPTHTNDLAERVLFEEQITAPCIEGLGACGFTPEEGKPGAYTRVMISQQNTPVTVHLKIYHSSLTSSMWVNQHKKRSQQMRLSKYVEAQFLNALAHDDIVFYVGHARHGSGPGFRPLEFKSKNWWLATLLQPMNANVRKTLAGPDSEESFLDLKRPPDTSAPKAIGFFVCDAEAHYGRMLSYSSPDSALLLTRNTIFIPDNNRAMFAGANAILTQSCQADLQEQLNVSITKIYYHEKKGLPKNITKTLPRDFNFFEKDKIHNQNEIKMLLRDHFDKEVSIDRSDL